MTGYAQFRIEPSLVGGAIYVNGEKVEGAQDINLQVGLAQPTRVTIRQIGDVEPIEGEGIILVEREGSGLDAKTQVLSWLGVIDPAEIERQALARQGWDSGSLAEEIIALLAELADEAL